MHSKAVKWFTNDYIFVNIKLFRVRLIITHWLAEEAAITLSPIYCIQCVCVCALDFTLNIRSEREESKTAHGYNCI